MDVECSIYFVQGGIDGRATQYIFCTRETWWKLNAVYIIILYKGDLMEMEPVYRVYYFVLGRLDGNGTGYIVLYSGDVLEMERSH